MMIAIGNLNRTYLHFSQKLIDSIEYNLGLANYILVSRKLVLKMLLNQKTSKKSFNSTNAVLNFFLEVRWSYVFLSGMLVL